MHYIVEPPAHSVVVSPLISESQLSISVNGSCHKRSIWTLPFHPNTPLKTPYPVSYAPSRALDLHPTSFPLWHTGLGLDLFVRTPAFSPPSSDRASCSEVQYNRTMADAPAASGLETTALGPFVVPRVWNGLWQLSSPAWGTAPAGRIKREMTRHMKEGYTAFGQWSTIERAQPLTHPCSPMFHSRAALDSRFIKHQLRHGKYTKLSRPCLY